MQLTVPALERGVVEQAWSALRLFLSRCVKDTGLELRHYPAPIARCDEQLPKLIEQRRRCAAQLLAMSEADEQSGAQAGRRERLLEDFLASAPFSDDPEEVRIRSMVRSALPEPPDCG